MASSRSRAVLGGLLVGVGTGITDRAEAEAAQAEELRREALVRAREIRQQLMRNEATRQENLRQEGLIRSTVTTDRGDVYGVTQRGVTPLGIRAPSKAPGGEKGALSDKDLIDKLKEKFTTTDDVTGAETVDWNAISERLVAMGRPDLAIIYAESGGPKPVDINSEQYSQAKKQAEREAKERSPLGPDIFRDKAVVRQAYGGKTRAEWTHDRTMELYRELTTPGAAPTATAGPEPSAPNETPERPRQGKVTGVIQRPGQSTGNKPQGAGSPTNPYRPTTQAEYDAIPKGAVFIDPDDGQLYRK